MTYCNKLRTLIKKDYRNTWDVAEHKVMKRLVHFWHNHENTQGHCKVTAVKDLRVSEATSLSLQSHAYNIYRKDVCKL